MSQITWLVIALDALFKGRFCCFPKDPLDDVETWGESVDKVLSCKGKIYILLLKAFGSTSIAPAHSSPLVSSRTASFSGVPQVRVQRGEHTVLACLRGVQESQNGSRDDLVCQPDLLRVCPNRSTQTGKKHLKLNDFCIE